jgi:hypothetical protein
MIWSVIDTIYFDRASDQKFVFPISDGMLAENKQSKSDWKVFII